jgi:hypothetical protein
MAADTEDTEDTAAMVGDTGAVAKTIRASAAYQQLCEGPEAAAEEWWQLGLRYLALLFDRPLCA